MRLNGVACLPSTNSHSERLRSSRLPGESCPKGEWTDHEDRLAAEWLQKQGILVTVDVAGQAVQTAARDHPIHPVKTYLHGLKWDGVQRVDTWLSAYLGAEDTEYARAVGSRWLISAVATNLPAGRQGGLLPDPRRAARNPQIDRAENTRRRVLHR